MTTTPDNPAERHATLTTDGRGSSRVAMPPGPDPDWLAERFHTVYEQMAPAFGYSTREESAVPWADVPKRNKMLMRAVAAVIEDDLRDRIAGEVSVVAFTDVDWLRAHATDEKDRARLIGAEDAYNNAIRAIQGSDGGST